MTVTGRRIGALVGAALVVLSGCVGPAAGPTGLDPSAASSSAPAPTPTASPTPDAEAAVREAWSRWWVATVAAERGNPDPAIFEGVGTGSALEVELAIARNYVTGGIVRAGEPTFSDLVVQVDGAEAMVAACMDRTEWRPTEAPAPTDGIMPIQLRLELIDGRWLVTDYVDLTLVVPC